MDLLRSAVSMLAHFDPDVDDTSREANLQKAIRLTAKTATLAAATYRISNGKNAIDPDPSLSHAANFLYMVTGNKPDPLSVKAFDTSLVAYAEHGFNASTFSGRVICSTLSDLYSSVVGSIGALKGPLHGGANEEAMKMLIEIGSADKAKDWIHDAIATKKKIMGFGHREYKNGDPRAIIMTELGKSLSEQLGETKWHDIATVLADVMVNEKKIHPNVDFPTAYIYYLLGLPIDLYTPIFALARVAGWTSHVIEQLENNRLIRPKAIYEGPEYQAYVPIEQRS
jgi:citrate synthase